MSLPILIPARNEAEFIGNTLDTLPDDVQPVVLANGCQDDTAEIARATGATVMEFEEPSKLRALQEALKMLNHELLTGFVIIDADTTVVWKSFTSSVYRHLGDSAISMVQSPVIFGQLETNRPLFWRSVWHYANDLRKFLHGQKPIHGSRMILRPNQSAIDEIVELPELWPGDDRAIHDVMLANGADYVYTHDPSLLVITNERGHGSVIDQYLRFEKWKASRDEWWQSHGPEDSVPYREWIDSRADAGQ